MRGRAVVARQSHKLKVIGSNPIRAIFYSHVAQLAERITVNYVVPCSSQGVGVRSGGFKVKTLVYAVM
jgi:hypothetical protein